MSHTRFSSLSLSKSHVCWYSLFKNRHEFKGFTSFGSQSYLLFQVVFKARWLINKVMQYLITIYKTKTIMLITGINILVLEDIYKRNIGWFMSLSETWVDHCDRRWPPHQKKGHQRSHSACLQCVRLVLVQREHQCWWRRRLLLHCTLSVFL